MDRSIGYYIRFAHLRLKQNLNSNLSPYNTTVEQWGLINSIYLNEGLSQKDLARLTGKDEASVTRMLDKLITKGFAYKKSCPQDKRSFHLYLTWQGRELRHRLLPFTQQTLAQALEGFSENDIRLFKKALIKICSNLEE